MVEGDRLRHWGPRLLAPIAFFLAATVLIVLVRNGLSSDDTTGGTSTPAATQAATTRSADTTRTTTEKKKAKKAKKRFYVIQSGDTFGSIADQFGTTVNELEVLNPGVDSAALTVGDRIRIR